MGVFFSFPEHILDDESKHLHKENPKERNKTSLRGGFQRNVCFCCKAFSVFIFISRCVKCRGYSSSSFQFFKHAHHELFDLKKANNKHQPVICTSQAWGARGSSTTKQLNLAEVLFLCYLANLGPGSWERASVTLATFQLEKGGRRYQHIT